MKRALFVLLVLPTFLSAAEVTLSGTLYKPYSTTPASCKIAIKGPTVPTVAGSTELIIAYKNLTTDTTGVYSFTIQPNDGMTPTGTQYLAEYDCSGVRWKEWWSVAASSTTIASVRVASSVAPTYPVSISLSNILQSGATDGQCAKWNASANAWIPGTCGSGGSGSFPFTTWGDGVVATTDGTTAIRVGSIATNTCNGPLTLLNTATVQRVNMTGNCVLTFPSAGLFPGQLYTVRLAQDATGGRTVSVSSNVHGFMVVSTGANTVSVQDFFWDDVKALWFARNTGVQNQ